MIFCLKFHKKNKMNTQAIKDINYAICDAAQKGDLDLIKKLHKQGLEFPDWAWQVDEVGNWSIDYASEYGHLGCLQYLFEAHAFNNEYFYDSLACDLAAEGGHLECLKYLYEKRFPLNVGSTTAAAGNGNLECLQYLHQKGCPWDSDATIWATEDNHLECLKYLIENGCQWNAHTASTAAKFGHFDCLQYAISNRAPFHLEDILYHLNTFTIDFEQHSWLRDFLFPHVDSNIMPYNLNQLCKQKIAQIQLEKQTVQTELTDKVQLDVIKYCIHLFI